MRATAWWAGALLWTGLAVLVAHASEIISPVYVFQGTPGSFRSGEIVPTQILRLDPMPNYIPYTPNTPWGPFQDFEQNYESVAVPYQRLPTPGSWLDDIQYPDTGLSPTWPRRPVYPQQRHPAPGYSPYRHPAPGYGPYRYPGSSAAPPCNPMDQAIGRLGSVSLPVLPAISDWLNSVPMPSKHVPLPTNDVAMPYYLDYGDAAGVRLPTLDVRMPTLGECEPKSTIGLWSGVRMPEMSVLGRSMNCMRMPATGFQVPNPSYHMRVIPRPIISIENSVGINVGHQPKGWDPSAVWFFPDTCIPESVLGRSSFQTFP